MSDQPKVYFAGPLFTQAEWTWNKEIVSRLRQLEIKVLLPQERSIPMMRGEEQFNSTVIFEHNRSSIVDSDIVVAVLDQADPDSGTAWECGYAYGIGKPIVGVRTDFRSAGDDVGLPVNLMLARTCRTFITVPIGKLDDIDWLVQEIVAAISSNGKVLAT